MNNRKTDFKLGKDIIPLAVVIALILVSFSVVLSSNIVFTIKHYIGIFLVLLASFLYFLNKKAHIYLFSVILIMGFINLIDVFYVSILFRFTFITFNPIFLILTGVFIAFNDDFRNKLFPSEKTSIKLTTNTGLINHYKNIFNKKSKSELKEILKEQSKYVNEAKIAARDVLKEKFNVF